MGRRPAAGIGGIGGERRVKIVWRRLTLTGFGRFAEPITIRLDPGINVLVAPNERGKSTLMAGFAATLFGLPAISDASQFGQAKFRNWGTPLRFEGELEFSRDDERFKVWRDFSNHGVKVSKRTDGGWEEIVTGEHNPRARRPNEAYESFLRDAVGVESVELFWSVFAFGSPLPEAAGLDDAVQRLVSGAGSAHYGAALKQLVETVATLTKALRAAGVSSHDRRTDGELEVLLEREKQLEESIQSGRAAVDERQQVQRRLLELTEERKAAEGEVEAAEAGLEAWNSWRQARTERTRALAEQSRAQRTWDEYVSLDRDAEERNARLERQYPEWKDAPPDAGDKLARLKRLEEEAEAGRSRRRGEIAAAVARGEEKAAAWRDFVRRRQRWLEEKARLEARFAPFFDAEEQVRTLYARFEAERVRLQSAVSEARRRVAVDEEARERRRAAEVRLDAERQNFAEQFGDLASLDGAAATAAIDERLEALGRREQLLARQMSLMAAQAAAAEETRKERTAAGAVAGGGLVGGALLAFALWRWTEPGWALAGGALVAAAALYWAFRVLSRRSGAKGATGASADGDVFSPGVLPGLLEDGEGGLARSLAEAEAALAPDPRLGPFAEAGAHQLGVLSQRLAARAKAAQRLAEAEAGLERYEGDPEAAAALAEAEEEERRFLRRVAPGISAFGEDGLAPAWDEWVRGTAEVERTEGQLRQWVADRFGLQTLDPEKIVVNPDNPSGSGGPGAIWKELARIALIADPAAGRKGEQSSISGAELASRMAEWGDEEGKRVVEAVVAAETEGAPASETDEIAALRRQLEPVLTPAAGDGTEAEARRQKYNEGLAALQRIRNRQEGLLSGQGVEDAEQLHMRIVDGGNRAEAARTRMEQLREQHPQLPDPDVEDDGESVAEVLLRLQRRRDEARAAARRAEEEYRGLLAREAALGALHTVNIAAAELELERLRRRRREVEFEMKATALAHRQLTLAAKDYEESHRDVLATKATAYFRRFTGRERTILIDEQFRIEIRDPDGPRHEVAQLSQGARDQLYMALRLAVADLVAGEAPLPLLLDDPFVHCDGERRARIREALESLEGGRQTVLFSHRDEFRGWGRPVSPEGEGWERA